MSAATASRLENEEASGRGERAAAGSTVADSATSRSRSIALALHAYVSPEPAKALLTMLLDLAVYSSGIAIAATQTGLVALGGSLTVSIAMIRLFVLGHDACHHALTSNRVLNSIAGRIAFLPTLTPYSYWEVGHNVLHHGFTNLKGHDYVWAPMSPEEFLQASRARQYLERIYRSAIGHGLYYFRELWWRRLFLPSREYVSVSRPMFGFDSLLVVAWAVVWVIGVMGVGCMFSSVIEAVIFAVVLPFIVWNCVMGAVIFVHHTHPAIVWYNDTLTWAKARRQCPSAVHLAVPIVWDRLFHRILQHPAHHLRVDIPFHRLEDAQRSIAAMSNVMHVRTSLRDVPHTIGTCKLFDFSSMKWVPFP